MYTGVFGPHSCIRYLLVTVTNIQHRVLSGRRTLGPYTGANAPNNK